MERSASTPLRIGAWSVNPLTGEISRDGARIRVEARTMRLLLCLAEHAGEVVSIDKLLGEVWSGVIVTPDSVYQAVTSLRRLLGDDPKRPSYIATVQRQGYRMIADVTHGTDSPPPGPAPQTLSEDDTPPARERAPPAQSGSRRIAALWIGSALGVLIITALLSDRKPHGPRTATNAAAVALTPRSIAVLPFLDLTSQKMDQEYFADGMTEELIDKLSKVPGVHVPTSTASFYFKGKKATVTEIAGSLGVAYVLDGSVRQSGEQLRVATRLVRADNGLVVWTETYDRPFNDRIKVQDDIAAEIVQALGSRLR